MAYKQPISRAQVASIRGVDPDGVLRTLQARGYVDHIGRDPGPGQALLWGTTPVFLEKLGLRSIDQLPPLAEYVPGADVVEALEHGLRAGPVPKASADPPLPVADDPSLPYESPDSVEADSVDEADGSGDDDEPPVDSNETETQ